VFPVGRLEGVKSRLLEVVLGSARSKRPAGYARSCRARKARNRWIPAGVETIEYAGALSPALIDCIEGSDAHVVGTFTILHEPDGIEGGDAGNAAVMSKVANAREQERTVWEGLRSGTYRLRSEPTVCMVGFRRK
jgi:hypothetical protein